MRFAQYRDIDLAEAFEDKLEANREAYAVDQVKGSTTPKEGLQVIPQRIRGHSGIHGVW